MPGSAHRAMEAPRRTMHLPAHRRAKARAMAKANTARGEAESKFFFDFERLPAYRRAEDFVAWSYRQIGWVRSRDPYMADQLHRAARSIALNVGEGGGEYSPAEKAHFYRMARRSATECVAITNILAREGIIDAGARASARQLLREIVSILVVMCRAGDRRARLEHSADRATRRKAGA